MNRQILTVLALILASVAPVLGQPKPASFDFKARMEQMLRAWESLDPSRAAQYYDKDPQLAFYDILPFKYTGWDEYSKGVTATFAGTYQSGKFFLHDDINIRRNSKVTWATATLDFEVVRRDGGRELLKDLRWTLIWEKRGNDWLLVHEHLSVPMGTAPQPK